MNAAPPKRRGELLHLERWCVHLPAAFPSFCGAVAFLLFLGGAAVPLFLKVNEI